MQQLENLVFVEFPRFLLSLFFSGLYLYFAAKDDCPFSIKIMYIHVFANAFTSESDEKFHMNMTNKCILSLHLVFVI